jgi:spermidine synthase
MDHDIVRRQSVHHAAVAAGTASSRRDGVVIRASDPETGVWFGDGDDLATLVDTAPLPDGGTLRLMRRGEHFAIMYGREQLMSSWDSGSEESLARLVCERLAASHPRLLIGGLGMGFTLSAALDAAPTEATILLAELVPEVLAWARGPLAHIFGGSLDDARVTLEIGDVHDVIVRHADEFDAILLDVDNGPDGLLDLANDRLYCNWGLRAAYEALRPGGILGIWSAYRDDDFFDRLEDAGFDVEEIVIDAGIYPKAQCHLIWLAHKSPATPGARRPLATAAPVSRGTRAALPL